MFEVYLLRYKVWWIKKNPTSDDHPIFKSKFGALYFTSLICHFHWIGQRLNTLRCQINEQGGIVITFFCLFVCFFLYVSLLALFPPYSFIWHLRVYTVCSQYYWTSEEKSRKLIPCTITEKNQDRYKLKHEARSQLGFSGQDHLST